VTNTCLLTGIHWFHCTSVSIEQLLRHRWHHRKRS